MPRVPLLLSIPLLASGPWAHAQTPASDSLTVTGELAQRVDRYLQGQVDSGFHGAVLIAVDGRIVLHKGYGWADSQRTRPVLTTTPFWLASITKQFAAAAVMRLVEQGNLALRDTLGKLIPGAPVDKRGITVHQLLAHTSGLAQAYAADGITTRDSALNALLAPALIAAPGAEFHYANDNYNLIAVLIELVSRRTYEQFIQDELLRPAGMTHTGFWGPPEHPEVAPILFNGSTTPGVLPSPNWGYRGAVGMYSTTGDLYRWYQAFRDHRILSAESWCAMMTPQVDRGEIGVGYGWYVSNLTTGWRSIWTRGYEGFGHGAMLTIVPDRKGVIVLTSNSGERAPNQPVGHAVAAAVAALVFPQ